MQTSDISAWVNRICFWQSKWPFITQLSGEFIKSLRNLKTHLWSEALFIDRFGFWKICPRDGKLYQEKLWRNLSALSEKAMAPHSSTLAWKIPWTEEPGRLQSVGLLEFDTTERLHFHFSLSCIGEGNGNPLQCSCLENPRDGEAWWVAVYGVTQSRTRLKWLSSSRIPFLRENIPPKSISIHIILNSIADIYE